MRNKFDEIRVDKALKESRVRRRKRIAGETVEEGKNVDESMEFEVDSYNIIMGGAVEA